MQYRHGRRRRSVAYNVALLRNPLTKALIKILIATVNRFDSIDEAEPVERERRALFLINKLHLSIISPEPRTNYKTQSGPHLTVSRFLTLRMKFPRNYFLIRHVTIYEAKSYGLKLKRSSSGFSDDFSSMQFLKERKRDLLTVSASRRKHEAPIQRKSSRE